MQFGHRILDYWDDILADLKTMIAIPSVSTSPEGIYPFGKEASRAIDAAMAMSKRYGLASKNVDYYAMHAQYGEGDENAVVMTHVDVVPAGDGWDTDPFTLVIKEGRAYGRGILDDKGSAVVALHCLRALKEAGIKGNRKLRVVLGSSEETGMADAAYYFANEQPPTMGFTPDGEYGICHCEKGMLTYRAGCDNDSRVIRAFQAGTVSNAVPEKAACTLRCSEAELNRLKELVLNSAGHFALSEEGSGITVTAKGVASHASMPGTGINAAAHLITLLYDTFGKRIGRFFTHIYEKIGLGYDGSQMGIAMSDTDSGALTYNLGIVSADEKTCCMTADIRYPATKDGKAISVTLRQQTEADGLQYNLVTDHAPLYLPKDSSLIRLLSKAYTDVTGDPCRVYAMGGGTYAREMFGKAVAFGPEFPERPDGIAHTANEFVHLDNLKLHAQICLEAMYLMLTAPADLAE